MPQSSFCDGHPIYVSDEDVFTEATAQAILEHNCTGHKLCGWEGQFCPPEIVPVKK